MPRFNECWRCQRHCTEVVICSRCFVAKYCSSSCKERDRWRHESDCDAAAVAKTCNACKKVSAKLKLCSVCRQVYYCDEKCQKQNRPMHKNPCKAAKSKILILAQEIASSPKFRVPILTKLYYWGNYPAYDYLNLPENEGVDHEGLLNVLVLGVGDLRNVAFTCASLPKKTKAKVEFTLNDIEPCTLARLVLLLYMLIKGEDDVVNQVTEVWYSTKLGGQTYRSLCSYLRELSGMLDSEHLKLETNGLLVIEDEHLNELKNVWKRWLELPALNSDVVCKARKKCFEMDPESQFGMYSYYMCLPSEHVSSAKQWMEKGVFIDTTVPHVGENPTLTGCHGAVKQSPYSYCMDSSVFPFSGWDYVQVKKFRHYNSLVQMYRAYINDVLRRFRQNLTRGHVICFKAVLADCMGIRQYLKPEQKFDRILTSNLADYILLPELLQFCSEMLNHGNPYATIVTEFYNWISNFYPDADFHADPWSLRKMRERVERDTGSQMLLKDNGIKSFREYYDNTSQLIEYIRALFHLFSSETTGSKVVTLPSFEKLGNEFQLKLRYFPRNENRVARFKMAINCRRATMLTGHERILEWIPMA